ncbi:MAG: multiheme c-type cytochrome, partial [Gemmatimonadaceae bacterium]
MKRAFAGAIAVVLVAALALWRYSPPRVPNGAAFVGSAQCGSCHTAEFQAWRASQHAAAMQVATPGTVLGDFRDASITVQGVTSSFFRQGDRFMVRTDGPDGALHDYAVRFTFGVYPLQQYLIEFPGGRLQPLTLAWDARPRQDGGARWFSLDEEPQAGRIDELHWTGRGLNWNYMCADCHSTAVRKGYDAAADSFHTTSAE